MSDWKRTTQECFLPGIRSEMTQAIQTHLETYNLGPVLDDALICIETTSEKKGGLFGLGAPRVIIECAILTPTWLVLAVKDKEPGAAVLSVKLTDLAVTDYVDSPGYKLVPDCGLELSGAFTGRVGMHGSQRITKFVGLGSEPAANNFRDVLSRTMQAVRR